MSEYTPDQQASEREKRRRERELLLSPFDPSEFGRPSIPVFTEPADDLGVTDELADPSAAPVRPDDEPTA